MRKVSLVLLFIVLQLLAVTVQGSSQNTGSDDYINVAQLKDDIQKKNVDRILNDLNKIKRMKYQGEILPFIQDLWNVRKDKYPEIPWDTVTGEMVRLQIANILLQAERNRRIAIDKEQIHEYIVDKLDSNDLELVREAVLTLGILNDERDVHKILSIAKQQNKVTFRAAVIALAEMCDPAAGKALDELQNTVRNHDLKNFVIEMRDKMDGLKKKGSWCQ